MPIHANPFKVRQSTQTDATPCHSIQNCANPFKLMLIHANSFQPVLIHSNRSQQIAKQSIKIEAKSKPIHPNRCPFIRTHAIHAIPLKPRPIRANTLKFTQIQFVFCNPCQSMPPHSSRCHPIRTHPSMPIHSNPLKLMAINTNPSNSRPIHANLLRSTSTNPYETNLSPQWIGMRSHVLLLLQFLLTVRCSRAAGLDWCGVAPKKNIRKTQYLMTNNKKCFSYKLLYTD